MSEALCLRGPALGDTGDVLALIRRLIASDTATARAGRSAERPGATAGRDILLPCAMGRDCVRPAMTPVPERPAASTTAKMAAGPAPAAGRVPDAAGKIAVGEPDQAPLRLNPEEMVADAAGSPAGRLRLPQGVLAAGQVPGLLEDEAPAAALETADTPSIPVEMPHNTTVLAAGAPSQTIRDPEDAAAAGPDPAPRESGPRHPTTSLDKETTMHPYSTGVVSPLHAEPPMTGLADRCAQGQAAAASTAAAPAAAFPAAAAPAAEENPLRALLREVVREEFEGEMQRRLDDRLRGMIRSEIVVALTEALLRRPAA